MFHHHYTFRDALAASERVTWRIEDLIGGDKKLDFTRPFMPEALARVEPLPFLSTREQLVLNQIRGHAYLCIFGLVEEFILPFVLDHVRQQSNGDDYRVRAFLGFAEEEAKHIHLFRRFREAFEQGFGHHCEVIGPAEAISSAVLAHPPLSVALAILHIEWMTQAHYVESVKDDQNLDPLFKSLLRHHWMEEAQHAKLDTLMVQGLTEGLNEAQIAEAIDGYLDIGSFIDGGLKQQVELDLDAFERAGGRTLGEDERSEFRRVQLQANRWSYLGSGMVHRNFLATLNDVSPAGRDRIQAVAKAFC